MKLLNLFYLSFYLGFDISFSNKLEPSVAGYTGSDVGGIWEMLESEPANILMETDASIEVATDTEGDLTSLLAIVENAVSESDDRLI